MWIAIQEHPNVPRGDSRPAIAWIGATSGVGRSFSALVRGSPTRSMERRTDLEMESFFGRFKTENASLLKGAKTLDELRAPVSRRMKYYSGERRHSSLGNEAPMRYAKRAIKRK